MATDTDTDAPAPSVSGSSSSTQTTAAAGETDTSSSSSSDQGGNEMPAIEDTGSSSGDTTTGTENTSTSSSSSSGSTDASSSSTGPDCEPACAADEECLDGLCVDADAVPPYGACLDVGDVCQIGVCMVDGRESSFCTAECETVEDCPEGPRGATIACDSISINEVAYCFIACGSGCPAGMECVADLACLWPA
jgi:hypothetical protein